MLDVERQPELLGGASPREVDAEVLSPISPARSSVVNYYGSMTVDYDRELAQLDDKGHRPLRTVDTDDPGSRL